MTRALITYFSLGGTTARVARHIATGLEAAGVTSELDNLARRGGADHDSLVASTDAGVEAAPPPAPGGYDLIGVGTPVHYYRTPRPVIEFVRGLSDLRDIPTFTFVLHGTYPGRAARELRVELEERGVRHLGHFSCPGADRYIAYLRKGFLFSAGRPGRADLAAARLFGRDMARAALSGPAGPRSAEPADVGWVYRLERMLTSPALGRHVYSRLFRVDARRCTGCGACERRCPSNNISLGDDRRPTWGRRCLLCLYCEMICPEEAIVSPVGWPLFDAFTRYNVSAAAADPEVGHARVVHVRGRTHIQDDPTRT